MPYDLEADRTEMIDLASKHSVRAEAMAALYGKWAARAQVEPWQKVVAAPRQS